MTAGIIRQSAPFHWNYSHERKVVPNSVLSKPLLFNGSCQTSLHTAFFQKLQVFTDLIKLHQSDLRGQTSSCKILINALDIFPGVAKASLHLNASADEIIDHEADFAWPTTNKAWWEVAPASVPTAPWIKLTFSGRIKH